MTASASGLNKTPAPSPSATLDATQAKIAGDKSAQPKPADDKAADKADDRWDALFASTGPNPAQNQLRTGPNRANKNAAESSPKKSDSSPVKPLKLMESTPASTDAQPTEPAPASDARQPAPPRDHARSAAPTPLRPTKPFRESPSSSTAAAATTRPSKPPTPASTPPN